MEVLPLVVKLDGHGATQVASAGSSLCTGEPETIVVVGFPLGQLLINRTLST